MKSNYKRLGNYIREVNARNIDLAATQLLGVNIDKFFMPSVANVIGTDMTTYKVVTKGQFACNRMHVGRDYRLPVALSHHEEPFMVSPAYDVFEIIDTTQLLPEYLMMWFTRKEFDRNAWFYTDADVRGGLPWKSFCDMELPIPSIEKQREIVKEYNTIVNRIKLNEQLCQKLEETAQTLYKHWFVDFEFPDENNKPYKSSGGAMEFNNELKQDIPKGWEVDTINKLINIINGYAFNSDDFKSNGNYPILKIKNITPPNINLEECSYYDGNVNANLKKVIVEKGDVLISMTGSGADQLNSAVGKVGRYNYAQNALLNQRVAKLEPKESNVCREFIYYYISKEESQAELLAGSTGSANQANISPAQILSLKAILPPTNAILIDFENKAKTLNRYISDIEIQNNLLLILKNLLLSKLATIDN